MFIEAAYAADGAAPQGGGLITLLIYLVGFGAIFYFLIFRPQKKRASEQQNLISSLEVGEEVTLSGGLLGKIVKISGDYAVVEVADGVQMNVQKHAITATLPKDTIKNI